MNTAKDANNYFDIRHTIWTKIFFLPVLIFSICLLQELCWAKEGVDLHPKNKALIKAGIMKYPKYFPNIPRLTAGEAFSVYKSGRGLFVLTSYQDLHLIVGGFHDKKIDYNKLPLRKGQILVLYCP